jgi:cell division protease FtsH
MKPLRRLASSARRLPSRAVASARRRPRAAVAGGLLILLVGTLSVGLVLASAARPASPATGPSFTLRAGWTLAELERHLEDGDVVAITADPSALGPSGDLLAKTRDGQVVTVDLSVGASDAIAALTALGYGNLLTTEAVGLARPVGTSAGLNLLALLIPLIFLGLTVLIVWRVSRRGAGAIRESSSKFMTILPPDPNETAQAVVGETAGPPVARVTLDDVAGCDEAKLELTETIEFLRSPDRFRRLGARIPRGVMLWGPPGTGKTMLARAVAAEAGVPFHYASGSEFVEKYVGVGAKRVRDLFAQARKLGRGVIFFDEFDAIGKSRGGPNSHEEREQTLNQLLVELDGFASTDDIIVIAATNRIDILDSAVLRPGRFNRKIHVGMPDVKGRREILDVHARNKPLAETTDMEEVARKTYGFSGAMLADLLNEAAILAARRGVETIEPEDLHAGWLKVAVGTSRRRSMDERERSIIAAHEVGHAICGKVHGDKRKVEEISLFAHGEALGVTVSSQEDNDLPSESDLRARLIALMGGRAAEEILFHEVTGGASNDFEAANRIATMMVTRWGMGRDPEATDGGVSGRGSLSFLVPTGGRSLPSDVQAAATRAIRGILDEAYAEASRTLVANLDTLRRLAAYLVEHERVDGATFDELFDGRRAVANAEDEWRAATARPRAWGDVVDLASRRATGHLEHQPLPATAATAPQPAGAGASDAGDAGATSAAIVGATGAPIVSSALAASPEAIETNAGDALIASTGADEIKPSRRRLRARRTAARRARSLAAGILGRAERWLRSGELEVDRL